MKVGAGIASRAVALCSLAAVTVLALGACGQAAPNLTRNAVTQASMQEQAQKIFKRSRLMVPPSATIEFAEYQPGMDDSGRVILVMPTVDWDAMRAAPPLNEVPDRLYKAESARILGENENGWHPCDDPSVVAAQVHLVGLNGGPEGLNVGVGKAGANRVRVYLLWMDT